MQSGFTERFVVRHCLTFPKWRFYVGGRQICAVDFEPGGLGLAGTLLRSGCLLPPYGRIEFVEVDAPPGKEERLERQA